MGTVAHVVVVGDRRLLDIARARVDDLEQRWSRFIPSSEISRLNRDRGRPVRVSTETFALVDAGVHAWRVTEGRFDPTVLGDMIRAGYDRTFAMVALHPQRGISLLRANCGAIVLDRVASTVTLPVDAGFDSGGIGKGLAADIVVDELIAQGADGACVNIGGDLRVEGFGPSDGRWLVAIEDPATDAAIATVALAGGGVATSTVAKRAWMIDGVRMHHVIDPGTGAPLVATVVSATALARSAAGAEVAATSALVAGDGQAIAAFGALECDGVVTDRDGRRSVTEQFDSFTLEPVRA
jgi:thiamine biosynthesis lipoprotein